MTTELPPAGWYPDPTGKLGQKYWDGQAWSNIPAPNIPATPQAEIPGTPTPTQPPVSTNGPSGQRLNGFALAGLALLAIAVLSGLAFFAEANFPPKGYCTGELPFRCGFESTMVSDIVLELTPALLIAVAIAIIGVTIAVRSDQSRARKVMFVVIAMVLVDFAVPVASTMVHHRRFVGGFSPSSSSPDSQQSPFPSSGPSAPNPSSPSYQQGLKSGTDGYAEV
jgi:hypothetical protein